MARNFDGSTGVCKGSSATPINFAGNATFSVSLWCLFTTGTGTNSATLWGHTDPAANFKGWEIYKEGSGASNFIGWFLISSFGGTNTYIQIDTSFAPTNNVWFHCAITYTGSTLASGTVIYINGTAQTPTVLKDSLGANSTTNAIPPTLAGRNNSTNFAPITAADACAWNVTLTALEVASLAKGIRPNAIRPLSLVHWWPADGLQSPEPDLSGNANNGTLSGTNSLAFGPPYAPFTPRWPQFIAPAASSFQPAWAMRNRIVIDGIGI